MKYILFSLIIVSTSTLAQDFQCQDLEFKGIVNAESGLNLREKPSLDSEVITSISYGEEVLTCKVQDNFIQIDSVWGQWVKCQYLSYQGYVFSGYLTTKKCIKNQDIKIAFLNDDHNVDVHRNRIPVTHCPYIGLFPDPENSTTFSAHSIEMIDTFTDHSDRLYVKIPYNQDPLFVISGLEIGEGKIRGKYFHDMLFPGEKKFFMKDENGIRYTFYAKGQPIESEKETFTKIQDYQLWIKLFKKGKILHEQMIYNHDLPSWSQEGYEGGAWIKWVGDLNNDGIMDVIVKTSTHYAGWNYKLLLSENDNKDFYKVFDLYGGSCC